MKRRILLLALVALLLANFATYVVAAPSMYVNWVTASSSSTRPFTGTWYVGDVVGSTNGWYNYEINYTNSWNNSNVYIGTNAGSMTTYVSSKYGSDGSNSLLHADISGFRFTTSGNNYVIGEAQGSDGLTVYENGAWQNSQTSISFTSNNSYFTVTALPNPTSQSAAAPGSSSSSINLSWAKDSPGHNVMIACNSSNTFGTPVAGTAYSANGLYGSGSAISGGGNVVYNSNGTSCTVTGLMAGATYYFKFFSENNSYYSAGVTANASTNVIVSFDTNTGNGGSMSNQIVPYNTATALTSNGFTKTGYTFNGWNTAANGSGTSYANSGNVTLTSNTTLYAQWLAIPSLFAGTLTSFGSNCINGTYGPNQFMLSGLNLTTANVTVSSLSGFTYSTSAGGTYTSSLSLSQPGGSYSQTIYVKFSPTLAQSYNGNIVVNGGGIASPINVAATGSGVNTAPTVTTPTSANIAATTVTLGGNLFSVGCSNVTEQGIYYSTTTPIADGAGTKVSTTGLNISATGTFTQAVTGLTASTVYYYKAFATNSGGTTYSTQDTFTTLNDISTADFRSAGTDYWNTAGNWQYNTTGSNWTVATQPPGTGNNVLIRSGHTIMLDVDPTIGSSKTLTVTGTLTAGTHTVSGTGTFAITGTLNTANTSGISGTIQTTGKTFTSGTINFNAGGSQSFGGSGLSLTGMDITTTGTVTLDGAIAVKSLTISSGTFDVSSSNYGLTIASGGTFSNSGTFNAQNGTLTFSGNGTITGSISTSLHNISLANASTLSVAKSISSSQIFNMASGAAYSLSFTNNATFTTAGISSSGVNTLNLLNGGSSAGSKFISSSDLTITTGTSLSLGTSALPLQVNGNVSLTGTGSLTLSSNAGGDILLAGNWSRSTGTFTPNSRAVTFNGSGTQTLQNTNSGSLSFDYLAVNNSGGSVQLLSDVTVNNNLQLFTGTLDLNQKTLTLSNTSSLELGDGVGTTTESILSSSGAAIVAIPTAKTVTVSKYNSAGTPSFSVGNNVKLSVTGAFNPGSGLTTFASGSTVQINNGGSVATNAPTYSNGSFLIYNLNNGSGAKFNQSYEWPTSASPTHVTLTNNSWVQLTANTYIAGDLTVTKGALQSLGARLLTFNGTTQTFTISTSSVGAVYGTDNGAGNDLTLVVASGSTTTLTGDATSTSDDEKKFFAINVNAGGKLALSRGILCKYGTFTVAGTLQINANGYVQATNGSTANYSTGSLIYNNGGAYTSTDKEWPTTSSPTNVTIQNSGTSVTMNNAKTISGTLTLSAGTLNNSTYLTLGNGASVIHSGGILSSTPTFGSTVNLNYTGSATKGNEFPSTDIINTLTVNNTDGIALADNRNIPNLSIGSGSSLSVNAGKQLTVATTFVNNGTVYLRSTASGTATILTPSTITGTNAASVEQYLPTSRNWYVSSPVTGATTSAGYTVYSYHEPGDNTGYATQSGSPTLYWESLTQGSTYQKGRGYIALPGATSTIAFNGTLNTGSVSTGSLTRTVGKTKEGFNLIGNPYPAYLNLATIDTTKVWGSYWLRSKNQADNAYDFDTYNLNGGLGISKSGKSITSVVPPMQAFWVRLKTGQSPAVLTFNNDMCQHINTVNNLFRAPATTNNTQQILNLQVSNGTNIDEAIIAFNSNALNSSDGYDTPKMPINSASIPEIYTLIDGEQFAINSMNSIPYDTEIPLGFTTGLEGQHSIKASQIQNFDPSVSIYLKDYNDLINTPVQLTADGAYSFYSTQATDNSNRFVLIFKSSSVTTDIHSNAEPSVWISVNGNNQLVVNGSSNVSSVDVYNALGQKMFTKQLTSVSKMLQTPLTSGVYFVTVNTSGKVCTKKVVVK